ncbi:MAG TPA: Rieske 2Fe-2S domain-containing protein [Acidimicrobiales bacterium]|nr:Rieske 2Fe-2S domain-containing protein [Acidimicrobiales bacterium]
MTTTTALLIAIPVLVVLAGVLLVASARRRDTGEVIGELARETRKRDRGRITPSAPEAAPVSGREVEAAAAIELRQASKGVATLEAKPPAPWVPPDPEVLGVTRRQFFNRGIITFFALGLSGFGAAVIAFLWPKLGGGFGSVISIGSTTSIDAKIAEGQGFAYYPEGRMWVTHYPASALPAARAVYGAELPGMEAGYVALYQKCPHLGCRVPECVSSQWFECQCHGSQYNRVGEKKGGPAPRGLDRFPIQVSGSNIAVDTGMIIQGPPIGTNTTGQEAEGPNCVSAGGGH